MEKMMIPPEKTHNLELSPDWQAAHKGVEIIQAAGFEAYFVGGAVRDILLGVEPKDFDIATNATSVEIEGLSGLERARTHDTAQAYGVSRVEIEGVELEVATFRRDINALEGRASTEVELVQNLEDDVLRRDFTINAMAYDPITRQLFDYVNGLDDLNNKIVRFVGKPIERIQEDPLRILRAVRFAGRLGFAYEPQTRTALMAAVELGEVQKIAPERLRDEITAILRSAQSRRAALEDLDELGILAQMLPDVTKGKGVEQGPEYHAEGDVWTHQLLIMEALPRDASDTLLWAALLHDIGKPLKQKMPDSEHDRITFHGHDVTSSELARPVLNRLKFSNADKSRILWLIEHHINVSQLPKMRPRNQKIMMNNDAFSELVELHRADGEASWRTLPDGSISKEKPEFQSILALYKKHQELPQHIREPLLKRDLGIDGQWLMSQIPGYNPKKHGTIIGGILKELEEMYGDGDITTREQAEAKALELLRLSSRT